MDKLTKSAIATGAAAVLLIGGWGTYAYWTGTADETVGSITTGALTVDTSATSCSTWNYSAGSDTGAVTDGIVPGDQATATCTVTFTGEGDHLWAAVTGSGASTATALPAGLTVTPASVTAANVTTSDSSTPTVDANGNIQVLPGITYTVTVDVVADWAYGASPGTPGPAATTAYALSDVTITVTQAQISSLNPQTT